MGNMFRLQPLLRSLSILLDAFGTTTHEDATLLFSATLSAELTTRQSYIILTHCAMHIFRYQIFQSSAQTTHPGRLFAH